MINLGEDSPFETIYNYIHNSLAPFFRSFIKKTQQIPEQQLGIFKK